MPSSAGLAIALAGSATAAPRAITGAWLNDDKDAVIDIQPCGQTLCGKVIWLKEPTGSNGQPLRDARNPSEALQNRPICGLQVISGLKPEGETAWDNGRVYDPDEGQTYALAAVANADQTLTITAYRGVKALGQSFTWTRAPAMKRCG